MLVVAAVLMSWLPQPTLRRLWNAVALIERNRDLLRGSVAQALAVMEKHLRHWHESPDRTSWRLWKQLADARQDHYQRKRSNQSRDYPRQKENEPLTEPKLRKTNRQERAVAQRILSQLV